MWIFRKSSNNCEKLKLSIAAAILVTVVVAVASFYCGIQLKKALSDDRTDPISVSVPAKLGSNNIYGEEYIARLKCKYFNPKDFRRSLQQNGISNKTTSLDKPTSSNSSSKPNSYIVNI